MRNCFNQGFLDEMDMACISGMVRACPACEQILVTGEISVDRLGDEGVFLLCAWNNVANAPLFALTDRQTVVMTRYEPHVLWNNIPSKRRCELFSEESRRFGVKRWTTMSRSFYEGVFEENKMFGKYVILDNWQDSLFVNAVLLLRKSCTLGIRMSQFFSIFSFEGVELKSLSGKQEAELKKVRANNQELLTLEEFSFLSELFMNEKAERKIIRFPA